MKDGPAREKAIEKLLAKKLRAKPSIPGSACLDAQTLAAYVERSLAPQELSSCETHLAACARCQEQVAQLVRLSEADLPASAEAFAPGPAPRAAFLRWAWAAPALVAIIVAGLWYTGKFSPVLRRGQQTNQLRAPAAPPKGGETLEVPRREDKSLVLAEKLTAPLSEKRSTEAASIAKNEAKARAKPAPPLPKAHVATPGVSGSVALAPAYEQVEIQATQQGPKTAAPPTAAPTPTEPPGEPVGVIAPPSARARLAGARPEAPERASESESGSKGRLVQNAETTSAGAPRSAERDAQVAKEKLAAGKIEGRPAGLGLLAERKHARDEFVQTRQPTSTRNWRVGAHGLIQKADILGNWLTVASGVMADLSDITFPTPTAGWAVGQAGTVLRTTDGGATWEKMSVPTREDLVRVTATSEQEAHVVTRSGRTFATSDSGKTWQPAQ